MNEPEPKTWHQKTWVRVAALLLLPIIAVGLYLISTFFAIRRPVNPPDLPEIPTSESETL